MSPHLGLSSLSLPPPLHPRTRSPSLSIARSPSILLTKPLTLPSQTRDLESQLHALSRTRSHPPPRHQVELEDVVSGDGVPLDLPTRPSGKEATLREEEEEAEEEKIEDEEEEEEVDERLTYNGGFQPPDSRETLSIALSFGAVVVLAIAAGLTTIYDWVL